MEKKLPLFMVIEGIDGSGINTQIRLFKEHDYNFGKYRIINHFQGVIRDIINLDRDYTFTNFHALRAPELMEAVEFYRKEMHEMVICNRYIASAHAYGRNKEIIDATTALVPPEALPDVTCILDLDEEVALSRLDPDGKLNRRWAGFLEYVRENYLEIAKENPDKYIIINADRPPLEVHKDIIDVINKYK